MDVFAKLKTRLDKLASSRQSSGNLLIKFQQCWDTIHHELTTPHVPPRPVERTPIPGALNQMLDILLTEQRNLETSPTPATNPCAEHFLNTDLLNELVNLSRGDDPPGVKQEVIQTLSRLVGMLEAQSLFHRAVNGAVAKVVAQALVERSIACEGAVLELESNVATKVNELPPLLNLFFTQKTAIPQSVTAEAEASANLTPPDGPVSAVGGMVGATTYTQPIKPVGSTMLPSNTTDFDFPLFDHLMRYLNTEGRHGDVARTSCSLLLDAGHPDMPTYLSQSDFVITVIGGLGGLFSQLPPQLPHVPGPGYDRIGRRSQGYASVTFARDVESLQSLMAFAHGVVVRFPDAEVSNRILRDFAITFLDGAVKPLLMTASDFDGTMEALLFYVRAMFEATPADGPLAILLARFLLHGDEYETGEGDQEHDESTLDADGVSNKVAAAGTGGLRDVELLVRDVLISKLNSLSEQVVTGTLRLLHLLLDRNRDVALPLLVEAVGKPRKLIGSVDGNSDAAHLDAQQQAAVARQWLALLAPDDGIAFEKTLEAYLEDAETAAARTSSPDATVDGSKSSSLTASPAQLSRDPTLQKLLSKLQTFFSQSTDINLALTGVLTLLCADPRLAPYLFAADVILPTIEPAVDALEVEDHDLHHHPHHVVSLHTVMMRLRAEADALGREQQVRREEGSDDEDGNADGNQDDVWQAESNRVVLEEFGKELVAVLLMAEGMGQGHIDFV
ncbi:hypothetical protein HKX48_001794 [Thoreauomyces humboldtii]|nr:hypothetical protein HKX48_001794 [Thoreauomyces humboldtii]